MNNPFAFPNPGGNNGQPFGQNPFSVQQMVFEVAAMHESSGNVKEGVMQVTLPCTATELHARKMILEMGYQHGWTFKTLKRLDGSPNSNE